MAKRPKKKKKSLQRHICCWDIVLAMASPLLAFEVVSRLVKGMGHSTAKSLMFPGLDSTPAFYFRHLSPSQMPEK